MNEIVPPTVGEYRMPRRTGIWILLASLLANCFMLGLVVAPALYEHPMERGLGPPGDFADHLAEGLAPADAAIMRALYNKEQPVLTAGHRAMGDAMHQLSESLRQPTADPAAVQKALAAIAAAHRTVDDAMGDLVEHAATDLSPEGRRVFSQNGLPPGPHGGPPDHRPPPPDMMGMPPSDRP